MKPLISYYGGKQRMVHNLLPLIPEHSIYVEPFAGGAALFFAKPEKIVSNNNHYREVLNDTNQDLVNLYWVAQKQKEKFLEYLNAVPYSEWWHHKAMNNIPKDDVEKAAYFYINIMMGFSNLYNKGFGFSKKGRNHASTYLKSKERLSETIDRLKKVYIFNRDALDIIKFFDCEEAFFYCDPPYPNTDQGHYKGYTIDHFKELVDLLKTIKGSFMLSCYDCMDMPDEWERYEFDTINWSQNTNRGGIRDARTEVVYRKLSPQTQDYQLRLF